jgi:SAM-dependent methyltransferase
LRARVPGARLIQMDVCDIPFEDEFDVIAAFDVLEHVEDDRLALSQVCTATRPGGVVILTVPQHPFLWSAIDDHSYHKRRYGREDLVEKVRSAGFELRRVTSFVTFLLPMMLLSRLTQALRGPDADPLREFKLHPRVGKVLGRIMSAERFLIGLGCSFPVGGSLLLVAGKP